MREESEAIGLTRWLGRFEGDQVVGGGIDFDGEVGVFVEEAFVVHLEGEGALLAGGGVFEGEDFDGGGAWGLGDGHAGDAGGGIDEDFDAAPLMFVVFGIHQAGEEIIAGVVFAFAVVPVAAVGDLELNSAEGVEGLLAFGGGGAEDEDASAVIGAAGLVTDVEDDAIAAERLVGVDDAAGGAEAGEDAVFDGPGVGGELGPAVEGFAVEEGFEVGEQWRGGRGCRGIGGEEGMAAEECEQSEGERDRCRSLHV